MEGAVRGQLNGITRTLPGTTQEIHKDDLCQNTVPQPRYTSEALPL
jgi:hypothetical protein